MMKGISGSWRPQVIRFLVCVPVVSWGSSRAVLAPKWSAASSRSFWRTRGKTDCGDMGSFSSGSEPPAPSSPKLPEDMCRKRLVDEDEAERDCASGVGRPGGERERV